MKCIMCGSYSLKHVCKNCQKSYLSPSISIRKLHNRLDVFSFYSYENIDDLLKTKHTYLGYYIYNILAGSSFKKFIDELQFSDPVSVVCVDEKVGKSYSHSALLLKQFKNKKNIDVEHRKIISKNNITYSGKKLEYRLLNSRNFKIKNIKNREVILVDDIITTGLTIMDAYYKLLLKGYKVLFAVTLADVRRENI